VIIDFSGMIDLVNSVHGINLDFAYPVRDYDKGTGHNMSGLAIPRVGCQTLNGTMALALARSRYYQYEERPGYWVPDGTGDLGRIQRQNVIIEAVVNKAKSSYNPLTLNAFVGSLVHDITVDNGMSSGTMISLAQRYHAFSGSSLQTATLPTTPGDQTTAAGAVEVVQEPTAQQVITQFLGTQPSSVVTAPLDSDGSPMAVPSTVTTAPSGSSASSGTSGASGSSTPTTVPGTGSFNPTSC
jgi:anionic cell wall polymer biosynthesis LytR-Cps2A-Psr (LCP) family protein